MRDMPLPQTQYALQHRQRSGQQHTHHQAAVLIQNASVHASNSLTLLNASAATAKGAEAIDQLVAIHRASGILDVDPSRMDKDAGQPVTLQPGQIDTTDRLIPVAGRVETTSPDGSKQWQPTHLIVLHPNLALPITQAMWDRYAAGGIPGFPVGINIADGFTLPLRLVALANEQLAASLLGVVNSPVRVGCEDGQIQSGRTSQDARVRKAVENEDGEVDTTSSEKVPLPIQSSVMGNHRIARFDPAELKTFLATTSLFKFDVHNEHGKYLGTMNTEEVRQAYLEREKGSISTPSKEYRPLQTLHAAGECKT